jgi:phosphoribosylanthranilate isomerase
LNVFAKEEVADKLFAVDINSKFEISPGVKDLERVRRFVEEMKSNGQ